MSFSARKELGTLSAIKIRKCRRLSPQRFWSANFDFKMTKGNKTCTGPRFPRILMNKVQDSCRGPRFPRIPRFFGTLSESRLIAPKNLGILGILGPVHESCTLFIRIPGNRGPVHVLWLQWRRKLTNLHGPKICKNPDEQSAGFVRRPRFSRIPRFFGTIRACAWILHFGHQDSWEFWAFAGVMKVLCKILFCPKKMHVPSVFWWWTSEFLQRVFIFLVEVLQMESRIPVLQYWVFENRWLQ